MVLLTEGACHSQKSWVIVWLVLLAQGSAVCCFFLCVTLDIVMGGRGLSRASPSHAFLLGTDPSGELHSPHLHGSFLLGAELGEPSMPLHVERKVLEACSSFELCQGFLVSWAGFETSQVMMPSPDLSLFQITGLLFW